MKRKLLIFIALFLPMQPILAQQAAQVANQQPPQITNTWLAKISNNFTKLPSWANLDWFKKIPKATWQKINKIFGGFKMQTFISAVRLEAQCNRIKNYNIFSKRKAAADKLLALIARDARGSYIFVAYPKFRKLLSENMAWIRWYHRESRFIGELDPAEMKGLFKSLQTRFNKELDELKRDAAVKNYLETGENICDKAPHPLKVMLLFYRDFFAIILLIIGIVVGIVASPDIYLYYKNRLFMAQPSQQNVALSAAQETQQAEENRRDIVERIAQNEQRVRDDLARIDVGHLLDTGIISGDDILFLGESDEKTKRYLLAHLEDLQTGRDDITQMGVIASTPYIKDENRWAYIQRLHDAGVEPTDLDKELMDLLEEKIGPPSAVKSAAKR